MSDVAIVLSFPQASRQWLCETKGIEPAAQSAATERTALHQAQKGVKNESTSVVVGGESHE
jgi:hypothetical protein